MTDCNTMPRPKIAISLDATTLARLLAQLRGVRHPVELPALCEEQILALGARIEEAVRP